MFTVNYTNNFAVGQTIPIGLDTEWPITYMAGQEGKIAVIQIALFDPQKEENVVYVFSVGGFPKLPQNLAYVLQSPRVIKYGNRIIGSDYRKLLSDWDCDVGKTSCRKLNWLCYEKGISQTKSVSLKKMTELGLGFSLSKDMETRQCDWKRTLTKDQISYAARDAYASFLLGIRPIFLYFQSNLCSFS